MENNASNYQLVLASASPRRLELLQQLGLCSKVHPVDINEAVMANELPRDLVLRLALAKARTGSSDMMQQGNKLPVLGSDTIVEINGEILGKPADAEQAAIMLTKLSGKAHKVHTAVAVVSRNSEYSEISSSEVEFAELTEDDIRSYVETGEPLDKAGAYAIQGIGGQFVKTLCGSYSGIMGLPLYETVKVLKASGIKIL